MRFHPWALLLLLVLPSACGGQSNSAEAEDVGARKEKSCELLSMTERAEVKRHVDDAIADSEPLATWRAWWGKYESRSFPYDVTQYGYYEWTGSSWAITGTTFDTLVYQFEDGSVIRQTGYYASFGGASLKFADGSVAETGRSEGLGDINDVSRFFAFADWSTEFSGFCHADCGSRSVSKAPFGELHTEQDMDKGDKARLTVTWPQIDMTYEYVSVRDLSAPDAETATVGVVRNGEKRSFTGPAAACQDFHAAMQVRPALGGAFEWLSGPLAEYVFKVPVGPLTCRDLTFDQVS